MDLQLKQWRKQQDGSEPPAGAAAAAAAASASEAPSAKLPRLVLDEPHHPQSQSQSQPMQSLAATSSTLPLFVPDKLSSNVSAAAAFPDSSPAAPRSFPRMGSYFSVAQWQELELQALIYRYMLVGAAVPAELLQPIKKSLLQAPYFLHHPLGHLQHYPQYQPALLQAGLQAGYWGRASMDPEPGRCRRTDGKKWRCSRDVVPGQKYCERHMHRGRNRSRKPVEIPMPAAAAAATAGGFSGSSLKSADPMVATAPLAAVAGGGHFSLSGPSPSIDLFQSYSQPKSDSKHLFESQSEVNHSGRSDGHILRHFFDDWPRSLQDSDNSSSNASPMSSSTCLSISIPGNPSSDVSLKLSTGHGDEPSANGRDTTERDPPQLGNWGTGWSPNQAASMGGPLAEALRSSTSHSSSPTSVLHQVHRGMASEASYVST